MTLSTSAKVGVAMCGLAGLLISWVGFFIPWMGEHGLDLAAFTTESMGSAPAAGLVWDLTACGALVTLLAVHELPRLGWPRAAAVLAGTWILGVSVGLGLLLLLRRPEPAPGSGSGGGTRIRTAE